MTGLCGFLVHRHVWREPPVPVPWGLLLSLAALVAVVRAAGLLGGVPALVAAAGGWGVAALLLQSPRPEGDFLLAGDALGYGFLLGGMAALAVAVVTGMSAETRTVRAGGAP